MIEISEDNTCRICLQNQDTLFSLFRKIKGSSPFEKLLNKTKLQVNLDSGPSSICSQCLTELDTTVNFLDKCEKSNAVLAARCSDVIRSVDEEIKSASILFDNEVSDCGGSEEPVPAEAAAARCPECSSLRRCKHWAPPATHTCHICQKVFNRKYNFKLHLKRHLGEREWACPECGAPQLTRWLARRHCVPRARRACPAPGCGNTYTSGANLSSHLRTHYGERPYVCTECGKSFTTKDTLKDHSRIHTGVKPYMCPVCGRQFATNKLAAHMRVHSGARPHACAAPACGRAFASRRALATHAASHAAPGGSTPAAPRRFRCGLCAAAYTRPQSLRKHTRQRHADAIIDTVSLKAPDRSSEASAN